jgi:zinc transport system ATP-binding protein
LLFRKNIIVGYMPQRIQVERSLPITIERFLKLRTKPKNFDKLMTIAQETGIMHIMKSQLAEISGGEFQRVLLAKALLVNPDLLVLDEPVQGVDVTGQIEFYKLIKQIRDKRQISVLMISHDLFMVMRATDHVVCLNHHICCEGNAEDVSKDPAYLHLFGDAAETMAIYEHALDHDHAHV